MRSGETNSLIDLARKVQATGYSFTTPTPASHARVRARAPQAWARDLRDVFGWSLPVRTAASGHLDQAVASAAGINAAMLDAMHAAGVLEPVQGGVRSTIRLSTLDGLLFAHSAYPTAAADAVFFGPDTYRFCRAISALHERQGTQPVRRAVDIGSGAGPGAIVIARAHPEAEVFAVDINDAALRLTRANAALAGVSVHAINSDLLGGVPGEFDLIVSNPPYLVDPAERAYRHGGGPLGAGLSLRILDAALGRLAPGGTLLLYTGAAIIGGADPFRDAAMARLAAHPRRLSIRYEEIDPDVFGEELETGVYAEADRIAAVALTVQL